MSILVTGAAPFITRVVSPVISIQNVCVRTKASTYIILATSAIGSHLTNVVGMYVSNSITITTQAQDMKLYLELVTFAALVSSTGWKIV